MPGFDGTGPRGMGPMTGGGRGFCASPVGSAGIGYRGRGFAGIYGEAYSPVPTKTELEMLRNEFTLLQKELEVLEAKLKSMEAQKSK